MFLCLDENDSLPFVLTCAPFSYSIEVLTSADAERALKFAVARNVRVVIKVSSHSACTKLKLHLTDSHPSLQNTGHEYIGRSTAPDSLQIWTHHMNAISEVQSYMPEGVCPSSVQPEAHAIRAGTGAMAGPRASFFPVQPSGLQLTPALQFTSLHTRSVASSLLELSALLEELVVLLKLEDTDLGEASTASPSTTSLSEF